MSVKNSASASKLDALYAAYAANPSKESLNALLADAVKYAKRVLAQRGYARVVDVDEVAQITTIKLWTCIGDFDGRCKFRSWFHRIVVNAALDKIRKDSRFVPMPEDAIAAEALMYHKGTVGGCTDSQRTDSRCFKRASGMPEYKGNGTELAGGQGGGRRSIVSEPPNHVVHEFDYEEHLAELEVLLDSSTAPDWLNEDYRVVMWYTLNGWKPKGIAKILDMSPKQVSNQIAAAKRVLQKHLSKNGKANVLVWEKKNAHRSNSRAASQAADD